MSSGAVSAIRAIGRQDLETVVDPQFTFWSRVHKRHSPFQVEPKRFEFQSGLHYGRKNVVEMVRNCDLMSKTWLVFKLSALDSGGGSARYVDDVGRAILEKVTLEMGGVLFDELYPEYMHVWDELTTPTDKQLGVVTGKSSSVNYLIEIAKNQQIFYVPLCFYFTEDWSNALPIVALHLTDVRISITLKSKSDIILASSGSYTIVDATDGVITDPHILAECVYLDDAERKWFAESSHKYLISQVQQVSAVEIAANETAFEMELLLNHPVKELFVMYRSTTNKEGKKWFNFTGNEGAGAFENEAFKTMQLKFNNNVRFDAKDPVYFRVIQPRQFHTRIPDKHIYVYSFALNPEDRDPSGSVNFSRIDNARLFFTFSSSTMVAGEFLVFARSINVTSIQDGGHLLRYSS